MRLTGQKIFDIFIYETGLKLFGLEILALTIYILVRYMYLFLRFSFSSDISRGRK